MHESARALGGYDDKISQRYSTLSLTNQLDCRHASCILHVCLIKKVQTDDRESCTSIFLNCDWVIYPIMKLMTYEKIEFQFNRRKCAHQENLTRQKYENVHKSTHVPKRATGFFIVWTRIADIFRRWNPWINDLGLTLQGNRHLAGRRARIRDTQRTSLPYMPWNKRTV